MLEAVGDIWDYIDRGYVIVITSNGSLTRDDMPNFRITICVTCSHALCNIGYNYFSLKSYAENY